MRIQNKSALLFFLTGIAVLVVLSVLFHFFSIQFIEKEGRILLELLSEETASRVQLNLKEKTNTAVTISSAPIVQKFLSQSNDEYSKLKSEERAQRINLLNDKWRNNKNANNPFFAPYLENPLAEFFRQQQTLLPGVYGEIFLTNQYGAVVASTTKLTTFAHAHKYWWIACFANGTGKIFFDDRGFDESAEGYVLGVTVPVRRGSEIIGILKCNINISGLLKNIVEKSEEPRQNITKIFRSKGLVVFEPGKPPLSSSISEQLLKILKRDKTISTFYSENGEVHVAAISPISLTLGSDEFGFGGKNESIDQILGNTGEAWHVAEICSRDSLDPLKKQVGGIIIGAGVLLVLLISVIALVFGRKITNPIVQLIKSTKKIGAGHLDTQIEISSDDEIGILADSINDMAMNLKNQRDAQLKVEQQLNESKINLEQEVEERTSDLRRNKELLETINQAQSQFITQGHSRNLFDNLLNNLLLLTNSEYGFIGEVHESNQGDPYLKAHAITNIAWNEETRKLYDEKALDGMEFRNLKTLIGAVLITGETVISNDPATDKRSGELPEGHPPLNRFMGLPFFYGKKFIGMVGIANRPEGYDESILEFLKPFLAICAILIHGYQVDKNRLLAEQKLQEAHEKLEQRVAERTNELQQEIIVRQKTEEHLKKLSLAVEESPVSVVITDRRGTIEYVNRKFCEVTQYTQEEAVGKNPKILKSDMQPNTAYKEMWETLLTGREWHGEFSNRKKDGSIFWEKAAIAPIFDSHGSITHFVAAKEDITREKEIVKSLVEARKAAEKANKAKSVFLSSMSHELRTPMNSILGFAQLLDTDSSTPLPAHQKEYLQKILRSGNHLLELINEVLDLAKIESGCLEMFIEPINLCSIVKESIDLVKPIAESHNIKILRNEPDKDVFIKADKVRFKQVVLNLLSNAIKYNKPNGEVIFSCEQKESEIRCIIADTGPGIEKDKQERLFEPFDRLGAETSSVEGTGIGLTITKRLVDSMEGSINLESELGKGTKFFIDFPLTEAPANEKSVLHEQIITEHETLEGNYTLLYVEDNLFNRELLEAVLERTPNLKLLSAEDAEEGIEMAIEHKPDLIFMDLHLPKMNGFEALLRLREIQETENTPVVALSGNAMPLDIKKAMNAGFAEYLTKPINISELYRVLAGILRR